MKVLHINRHYLGTELHHNLIDKLNEVGVENWVFVPQKNANIKKSYIDERVKVVKCFNKFDSLFYHIKQIKIYSALTNTYDVKSFNLVHAYTVFTDGYSALRIKRKYNIPYVVAVRNTDVNDFFKKMPWLRRLGEKILLDAEKVLFLSKPYYDVVIKKYIHPENRDRVINKSLVIPNGIDDFWHKNEGETHTCLNPELIQIICAGKINRNKNITTLQQALQILQEEGINTSLTLIGKIEDNTVFKKIQSIKPVTYIEPQPKEKLINYYRDADIFVMPSLTETFGLVYAEAMSQGLPIVYTKGQGFDGQFEEGEVGFHADARSPESVAEAIKRVAQHYNELCNRVIERSRRFSWDVICERYIEVYRAATGNRS